MKSSMNVATTSNHKDLHGVNGTELCGAWGVWNVEGESKRFLKI